MLFRSATKHNSNRQRYNDCYPHNSHSHSFKIPKLSAYAHSRLKLQNGKLFKLAGGARNLVTSHAEGVHNPSRNINITPVYVGNVHHLVSSHTEMHTTQRKKATQEGSRGVHTHIGLC